MYRLLTMSVLALVLHLAPPAMAEDITWQDLIDRRVQDFDDPFRDLTFEQIEYLRAIVQAAEGSETGAADQARSRLAAQGIDADRLLGQRWIIAEKRKKAATAVNPALHGRSVTLEGFAIAAPPEEDGTRIVYLVPERGMCAHTPPPNPNQMIRVRLTGDWSPSSMHEPVRLTGTLMAKGTQHSFRIVDGIVPMRASFVMEARQIETLADVYSDMPTTDDWAAGLAERLRAARQTHQDATESDR